MTSTLDRPVEAESDPAEQKPPTREPALGRELTEVLLRDIKKSRVQILDGLSHLEAWDVRAHLDRLFGFAEWSADTIAMEYLYEQECEVGKAKRPGQKVAYRAQVRLMIHATGATYTEWAVGESTMPDFKRGDCHDMAIKTAESQALKRAATNLGTQFGLSLYNSGSLEDVVKGVVGFTPLREVPVRPEPTPNDDGVLDEWQQEQVEQATSLAAAVALIDSQDRLRDYWAEHGEYLDVPIATSTGHTTLRDAILARKAEIDEAVA